MKYIITGDGVAETRSDKTAAIKLADAKRAEARVTVTVTTEKGAEVYVTKVRKAQKRTAPYTRVDARDYTTKLAAGVHLPRNFEVAYLRPRSSLALLRKVTADSVDYLVFDLGTGESQLAETTREGGKIMTAVHKGELELVV